MYLRRTNISTLLLFLYLSGPGLTVNLHPPEPVAGAAGRGYDPVISPNGRYLAFTSDIAGNEDIWVVDLKKREKWRLTRNTSADYSPCFWGNDKLLFVSTRAGTGGEIYSSDLRNANIRKIIGGGGYFDSPSISPDNKIIAYVHSEGREKANLYFLDVESGQSAAGPPGIEPAFSPSERKVIFLYGGDSSKDPAPAMYNLNDSSVTFMAPMTMTISNPSFLNDGRTVIFAVHDNDTDLDGIVTRNDDSRLALCSLDDPGAIRWLYSGYPFGNAAVSPDGRIFAVSPEKEIYSLWPGGPVSRLESAGDQAALCDSLLHRPGDRIDSLFTAAVCLASFYHHPDSCGAYLLIAADQYAALGMTELALDILSGASETVWAELAALAALKKSEIEFNAARKETALKAWRDAYEVAGGIMDDQRHSPETIRKAYLHGIEVSYVSGRLDESDGLIADGLLRFAGDDEMTAMLEIWRLRHAAKRYAGDPLDLVQLYMEFLIKLPGQQALVDTVIEDVIDLTRELDAEMAINALDNIRRRYPADKRLSLACLYEQGRRLEGSNQTGLARWKYEEIVDDFYDYPEYRLKAFGNLAEIRLKASDLTGADVYMDSARGYLSLAASPTERMEFLRRYSRLKTVQGYALLERDAERSKMYFRQAYEADPENIDAVRGLARSIEAIDEDGQWEDSMALLKSDHEKTYFKALRRIFEYERSGDISVLRKARQLLLETIEQDRRFTAGYLALGYVDCLLENVSAKTSGLYEEAVDVSLIGLSLVGKGASLESAFLLNLAEGYYGLGQYGMAYDNYMASLRTDPELLEMAGSESLLLKISDSAFQIDSLDRAEQTYMDLYSRSSNLSNAELRARAASKLGLVHQAQGQYVEALEYYEHAFPYYSSRDDLLTMANIQKCEAICYDALGETDRALEAARKALELFARTDRQRIYDNRIKLTIWPFGLTVPVMSVEGMSYGGSVYPGGLTGPANRALLTGITGEKKGALASIETHRSMIQILTEGGEEHNTVDLRNSLGRRYFEIGYFDSAAAAFRAAYQISKERNDYVGAYVQLTDWAVSVLYHRKVPPPESFIQDLEVFKSESQRLFEMIPVTYSGARAGLKNIAGVAEFSIAAAYVERLSLSKGDDLAAWMDDLNAGAGETVSRLEEARRLFREGNSEIAFGDEPALLASLSLNEALTSIMLADEDGYKVSMTVAVERARDSGSQAIYAGMIGVGGLLSDEGSSERYNQLAESINIYENLKPGPVLTGDMPLIEKVYGEAVEASLSGGDSLSAPGLLERKKGLELACMLAANPYDYSRSPLLSAYIGQAENHRRGLARLEGDKRRLQAMGTTGRVELKKTEQSILETRSRFLELKEEINSLNPRLASILYPHIDPAEIILPGIPATEICLVPFNSRGGGIIWACSSDGIESLEYNAHDEISGRLSEILSEFEIVTIAAGDRLAGDLREAVQRAFPDTRVKMAFSLNEAYGAARTIPRRLEGIGLISFDGGVIDDRTQRRIEAFSMDIDLTGNAFGSGEYGWLVIDGDLHWDNENPLMSFWQSSEKGGGDGASRSHLYEVYRDSITSFGVIVTGFPDVASPTESWAAVRAFFDAGAGAVITIPAGIDAQVASTVVEEFFEDLKETSPLESFRLACKVFASMSGAPASAMNYYGNSGRGPAERKNQAMEWCQEFVYAGYGAMADSDWKKAIGYFEQARRQSELAGLPAEIGKDLARKLVDVYIKLGDYERALAAQAKLIELIGENAAQAKKERRRYVKIAADAAAPEQEISGWKALEDLGLATDDSLLVQECHLEMAEYYLNRNDLSEAERLIHDAIWDSMTGVDSSLVARRHYLQGQIDLLSARYDEAETGFESALRLYEKSGDMMGKHNALLSLAVIYGRTGRLLDERKNQNSALEYFENSGDSSRKVECLENLGHNYLRSGRLADARIYAEKILKEKPDHVEALILLSDLARLQGDLDSAYDTAVRSLDIATPGRSDELKARAHYNLGKVLNSLGEKSLAADEFLLALEFAGSEKTGSLSDILKYEYASVAEVNGDTVLAALGNESSDPFIRDLCRYRTAVESVRRQRGDNGREYLEDILRSENRQSDRYLKWRSLYLLGTISAEDEKRVYFARADSAHGQSLPEPEYIVGEYSLEVKPEELWYAMADDKMRRGQIEEAMMLNEKAAVSRLAAAHLSSGVFDEYENEFLDSCLATSDGSANGQIRRLRLDFLRDHPDYRVLWGQPEAFEGPAGTDHGFTRKFEGSQAAIRFYVRSDSIHLFYADADTAAYNRIAVDPKKLETDLALLPETMRNQKKADSLLERWYSVLLSEFEDLMQDKDEILLIPDGPFVRFPLEALKMPDGDYLSEMFRVTRGTHLPTNFPGDSPGTYLPCITSDDTVGGGPVMDVVESVSAAVGDCRTSGGGRVTFTSAENSMTVPGSGGEIICFLEPLRPGQEIDFLLELWRRKKDGYSFSVQTLWPTEDQANAYYYWVFLDNLRWSRGAQASQRAAASFVYGRYRGSAYYWPCHALYSLD